MMNLDIVDVSRKIGKPVCAFLYAYCGYLAAKRRPLMLLTLVGLHTYEYFTKAKHLAEKLGIDEQTALLNCLAFGFTWWLPLQKDNE